MLKMHQTNNDTENKKRSAQYLSSLLACKAKGFKAYGVRKLRENMFRKEKALNLIRFLCLLQKTHSKNSSQEAFARIRDNFNRLSV